MLAVTTPGGLAACTTALGDALGRAASRPEVSAMLASRFSDLFVWATPDSIEFRRNALLVEIVSRPTHSGGCEMTFRPTQRFTDLVLAVGEITQAEIDFTDGWPVITSPPAGP